MTLVHREFGNGTGGRHVVLGARKLGANQPAMDEPGVVFGPMRWIVLGTAGLVLLIGVAGILNVGLATVGERVEEFALRRAVGTPDSVAARLRQLQQEIGFDGILTELNCGGLIPHDRVVNAIRLLCQEVMPQFR